MKNLHRFTVVGLALFVALTALPAQAELENQMMRHLVAPEVLMRFAEDIELGEDQRRTISEAIKKTQAEATEIQWQLQSVSQALVESLAQPTIDKEQALTQARAVMDIEQKVKLRHLTLLIEIRSQLRPDQIERLRQLERR